MAFPLVSSSFKIQNFFVLVTFQSILQCTVFLFIFIRDFQSFEFSLYGWNKSSLYNITILVSIFNQPNIFVAQACRELFLNCASLTRWDKMLERIMKLQTLWCKDFGILLWHWLQMMMKKHGGSSLFFYIFLLNHMFSFLLIFLICLRHFSEGSLKLASEGAETGRSTPYPSASLPNTFAFKIQDRKGRMHRFNCGMLLMSPC